MDRQCEAAETKNVLKDQLANLYELHPPVGRLCATCGGLYYRDTERKGFRFARAIWFSCPGVIVPFVIVTLKILFCSIYVAETVRPCRQLYTQVQSQLTTSHVPLITRNLLVLPVSLSTNLCRVLLPAVHHPSHLMLYRDVILSDKPHH